MKIQVLCLAGVLLAACSGDDQTGITDQTPPETTSSAALIDSVDWHGEHIDFYDGSAPGDELPGILVLAQGPAHVDLGTLLESKAQYSVTPAELWQAATGETDVPPVLLAQHQAQAAAEGRPVELQQFDLGSVEKANHFLEPNFFFALDSAATGLPADNVSRCWENGRFLSVKNIVRRTSACTEVNRVLLRNGVDVGSDCDPAVERNLSFRHGFFNNTGAATGGRICFRTGTKTTQCFSGTTVPDANYLLATFTANGNAHSLSSGANVTTAPGPVTGQPSGARTLTYGTADLIVGVRAFSNTSCGQGFPETFEP